MSDLNIDAKAISDSLKSTLGDWKDSVKDDVVGYVSAIADGVASCLLYTSPSPRDKRQSRMPSSA